MPDRKAVESAQEAFFSVDPDVHQAPVTRGVDEDLIVYGPKRTPVDPDSVDWAAGHGATGGAALIEKLDRLSEGDQYWTTEARASQARLGPVAVRHQRQQGESDDKLSLF